MTPITTRSKTDRRYRHSSTGNDGARPRAAPAHRLKRLFNASTLATDLSVVFAGLVVKYAPVIGDLLGIGLVEFLPLVAFRYRNFRGGVHRTCRRTEHCEKRHNMCNTLCAMGYDPYNAKSGANL